MAKRQNAYFLSRLRNNRTMYPVRRCIVPQVSALGKVGLANTGLLSRIYATSRGGVAGIVYPNKYIKPPPSLRSAFDHTRGAFLLRLLLLTTHPIALVVHWMRYCLSKNATYRAVLVPMNII